jgi:hypothetical protein
MTTPLSPESRTLIDGLCQQFDSCRMAHCDTRYCEDLAAARAALEDRLRALERDAARLDWLHEGGIDHFTRDRDNWGIESGKIFSWGDSKEENRIYETLRDAIDARMAEESAENVAATPSGSLSPRSEEEDR